MCLKIFICNISHFYGIGRYYVFDSCLFYALDLKTTLNLLLVLDRSNFVHTTEFGSLGNLKLTRYLFKYFNYLPNACSF